MAQNKHIQTPFIVGICLSIGILIGWYISTNHITSSHHVKELEKFAKILDYIESSYVDSVQSKQLIEDGIVGMLDKLDPHTNYIPEQDKDLHSSQLEANFEGIGIEFDVIDDTLYVINPIESGPSEKAGLLPGDKIVRVNGKNIAGIKIHTRDIFSLLRGDKGTKVTLGILRKNEDEVLYFDIIRDEIPNTSIEASYLIDGITGYIKISRFAEHTDTEFSDNLASLKRKGMERLIIDLRHNGGGYLTAATNIVDEFLDDKQNIVLTKGKNKHYSHKYLATHKGQFKEGAVIVLIDENSASASEIVAGALQDNDRALIVGRRSFGKGLVQLPFNMKDDSELRLTISRYYIPSGRCIQKPYEGGKDNYQLDHEVRTSSGEYFHQDSIKKNDTLIYYTLHGREVHGGGGIYPDEFIPLDTTENTTFAGHLFNNNIIRTVCLNYVRDHKSEFENISIEEFKTSFVVNEELLLEILRISKEKGIIFNKKEYNRSKNLIETYTKALIAKGIYDNQAYYKVFNERDNYILESLKLFDKAHAITKK